MKNAQDFLEGCNQLMSGQPPHVILERALNLLRDPCCWERGRFPQLQPDARARDLHGRAVRPENPCAVCWDIEGAVALMCNNWGILPPYFMLLLDSLAQEYGIDGINLLESVATHESVVTVLERAVVRSR